jgi:CubicO group peptidase (beta-lactamase class C family)
VTAKPSEPDKVDAYMKRLKHPLTQVVEALRRIILKTDRTIGEEIKWNAPTFFYTGELPPFDPKEYKRYLVVFNLFRKDCIRLVFWRGAEVGDTSGFLAGEYKDGRRLASFSDLKDVTSMKPKLQRVLKQQLKILRTLLIIALIACSNAAAQRLPRSSPERQGISSSAILAFVERADSEIDAMHSFMLVRHGHVVAEGWWSPYDSSTPHMLYSLSKSFTSTAVGLAIAAGKLSLDDPVLKFFPEDAPAEPSGNLKSMRVRDLLRMATGHDRESLPWHWTGDPAAAPPPGQAWTKTFLAQPVPFKPGTHFLYNSPATYMLSAIVQKATGQTVLDYLRPRLFQPLGIDHPDWGSSPQGVSLGAFGLLIRTEDIARFGQLYLQNGKWNGRQLVPAAWVSAATSLEVANGSSPESDWDQGYGFQFWRSRHNSFRGDGAFGQYCMVLPDVDAVVVITGGVRNMQSVMNLVWDVLLPAMGPRPLAVNAAAERRLRARLGGLTLHPPPGAKTGPLAGTSGRWYALPDSGAGPRAVALDFGGQGPALLVRTATGETRMPFGIGTWAKSRGGFTDGIDQFLSVPPNPLVAASGAWTRDSVFTLKLALYQTPYGETLRFRFDGDRVVLDREYNVSFGPTTQPQLIGLGAPSK